MTPSPLKKYENKLEIYLKQSELLANMQQLRELMEENHESEDLILKVLELVDENKTIARHFSRTPSDITNWEESGRTTPLVVYQGQETSRSLLTDNSVLKKYEKMYYLGVPLENVLMRMKLDSLSAQSRNKLLKALGRKEMESEETPTSFSKRSFLKSQTSLANINWNPLPAEKLRRSVWVAESSNILTKSSDENEAEDTKSTAAIDIEDNELRELQKLFIQQQTNSSHSASNGFPHNAFDRSKGNDAQNALKVLDRSRAQNISIGLLALKGFGTTADFLRAIVVFDTCEGRITADVLDTFKYLLPTESELKRVADIGDSSHPAELFLLAAVSFYPELPKRLQLFRTCLTLENDCRAALATNKNIVNTCNQVRILFIVGYFL